MVLVFFIWKLLLTYPHCWRRIRWIDSKFNSLNSSIGFQPIFINPIIDSYTQSVHSKSHENIAQLLSSNKISLSWNMLIGDNTWTKTNTFLNYNSWRGWRGQYLLLHHKLKQKIILINKKDNKNSPNTSVNIYIQI